MLYSNMSWMDIIPNSQYKAKSVIGKYKQMYKDDSKKSSFPEMCISSLFYVDMMTTREKGVPCFGFTYMVNSDGTLTIQKSQLEFCMAENACEFKNSMFFEKEKEFILETCTLEMKTPHTQTLAWRKVLDALKGPGQTFPFVVPYSFAFDQDPAEKDPEELSWEEARFLWGEDILFCDFSDFGPEFF